MNKWTASFCAILLALGWSTAWPQTPPARPSPPRPRPLLLLAPFTGEKLVVRVQSATTQGPVLQAELPDGSRSAYDQKALVATLPWYSDAELTGGAVDLAALGKVYDDAVREHREFATGLLAEKTRVHSLIDARDKDRAARVAAVLSARYDPAAGNTIEDLRARLRAADEAAALEPSRQTEIARAVTPFREALANLEAGKGYSNRKWLTPEEIRQQTAQVAESDRLRAFEAGVEFPLATQIIAPGRVNGLLGVAGLITALPVAVGILFFARRKRLVGGLLIILTVAGGTAVVITLLAADFSWPATPGGADDAVLRALASAQGPTPDAGRLEIGETDLNAFFSRRTKLQGDPVPGAINLHGVAVALRRGGVTFCETAEWRGRILRIRLDYGLAQNAAGRIVVSRGDTLVGNVKVPDSLVAELRLPLENALDQFLKAHDPRAVLASARLADNRLELVSNVPAPSTPPPQIVRSTPAPTPAVVEMPTPTPTPTPIATSTPAVAETTPEPKDETPELPPLSAIGNTPGPDNTFYVYAIWDGINSASPDDIGQQMDRLREQFGKGNRYHRVGFAFILGGNENQLRTICNLARQKNMAVGVILGAQTHTGTGKHEVMEDFRAVQWRLSGEEWRGGKGPRDAMLPTPSRYCRLVRDALENTQRQHCDMLRRVMTANPGVITCIDGTIEEELADGGQTSDDRLADYSPYAVTEFRDWLRHTGEYDADRGRYAGQGAPERLTGGHVTVRGKPRSPFYEAATPDTNVGNGSFNQRFGTHFKTWTLKYWDLKAYPQRIIDEKFNPMPDAGPGFTEGGFDAPRRRAANMWWQTWSWDNLDNGRRYPPGDPEQPAYGFRQVMIRHFVLDMFQIAINARLPANLMFAHQLPGEALNDIRDRSSASPVWTGYLPFNGTVGVTKFGGFDPALALRYTKLHPQSRGWGLFEWHPMPNAKPDDPKLYQAASDGLRLYYRNKCHHLFAGWWTLEPSKPGKDFPLADSQFAKAIKDFMDSCPDQPYPGTPR